MSVGFLQLPDDASRTTPLLTLVLDQALIFLSLGPLLHRDRRSLSGWAVAALFALVGAAVLSTAGASNRRLALNAGMSMVAISIAAIVIISSRRSALFDRALLAAMLATLTVFAVKCLMQVYVEFPEVRADWEQRKAQLASDAYRPEMINFERRLYAAEASGYQSHSNVAASLLSMGLLSLAGLALAALKGGAGVPPVSLSRPAHGNPRLIAAIIAVAGALLALVALRYTGSTGAYASVLIGLAVLGFLHTPWASRAAPHRLLASLLAAYLLFVAALIGWGVTQGTFPHASLAFRWEYWTAGMQAYSQQPWTGLGRENFLAGYLQFKQAWATEEVRNPHSLWATLLFEMGPLGLIGGAALLVVALASCLRRVTGAVFQDGAVASDGVQDRWALFVIPALVIGLQAWAGENHFGVPGWAVIWFTELALPWIGAFALLYWALAQLDRSEPARRAIAAGLTAALVATVFHNTIDFSLTTPAGQAALVALVVSCSSGLRKGEARIELGATRPRRTMMDKFGGVSISAVGLAHAVAVVFAATNGMGRLPGAMAAMRSDASGRFEIEAIQAVLRADWLDPVPPRSLVREWLRSVRRTEWNPGVCEQLRPAREWIALAIQRDPRSLTNVRLAADVEVVAARCATSDSDRIAALEAALRYRRRATELYPTDPRGQIQLAVAAADYCGVAKQVSASQPAESAASTHEAATDGLAALKRALEIDATRKPIDVVRLQPEELRQMEELRNALVRFAELKR
ncbi:MAG: O-antigen ligase family protein [Phycisphaerae bacterium]|nr:O-antigen ligase family protein [Phycisphaerae bacterium]